MATKTSSKGLLATLSEELSAAVERAGRAVVTVHGRRRVPGSGIVWPGGVIVTADHVLEREEDILVTLADGREAPATVAGRDPGSDIAVLRLASALSSSAELAPAGSARVGHLVLALGRPGGAGLMASFGIVSAVGGSWRTGRGGVVDGYLRADLALYPGFSGGPLVNAQGLLVGLNSSHLARGQELALPAHTVDSLVQMLVTQGRVRRAYVGVSSQPVPLPTVLSQKLDLGQDTGLLVVWVESGSPAERGGLLIGDVLIELGDQRLRSVPDLQAALRPGAVGMPVKVTLVRGGERRELSLTPGERA